MLDGILPISFLFFISLSCLATTHESVPEIIGGIFTQFWIPAQKRLRKMIYRLGKIAEFIGGRSSVEMEFVGLRSRSANAARTPPWALSKFPAWYSSSPVAAVASETERAKQKRGGRAFTQDDRPFSCHREATKERVVLPPSSTAIDNVRSAAVPTRFQFPPPRASESRSQRCSRAASAPSGS